MERKRLIDLYEDEFQENIVDLFQQRLDNSLNSLSKGEELISRKQLKDRLGIAFSTLDDYRKKGIITGYQIGNRVFFKWSEIIKSANEIK